MISSISFFLLHKICPYLLVQKVSKIDIVIILVKWRGKKWMRRYEMRLQLFDLD
jgi:hypothetical protein